MDKPAQSQTHALESLRLESECLQVARRSRNPDLQAHFLDMARHWNRLSTVTLENAAEDLRDCAAVAL